MPPPALQPGGRTTSRSVRAMQNAPTPWEPEHDPFEADRLDLQSDQAQILAEHERRHRLEGPSLESFAHPDCRALSEDQLASCPLGRVRWSTLRDVPGGIELETQDRAVDADLLRWELLCHIAWARAHPIHDPCPIHVHGVEAYTVDTEEGMIIGLVAPPAEVGTLRRKGAAV